MPSLFIYFQPFLFQSPSHVCITAPPPQACPLFPEPDHWSQPLRAWRGGSLCNRLLGFSPRGCSSFCQGPTRLLSILPAWDLGSWGDAQAEEGRRSAQVPPACSKRCLHAELRDRALGLICSGKAFLVHVGPEPKHAVWRKHLIKTWEPQTVYLFLQKGGDRMPLESASKMDHKVVRPGVKQLEEAKGMACLGQGAEGGLSAFLLPPTPWLSYPGLTHPLVWGGASR